MPETNPLVQFDENGVCGGCRFAEMKEKRIDWAKKRRELEAIFEKYRSKDGSNYDCIVPVSGGKDSTFQLYTIKHEFGMNPLCVCYMHDWWSDVGHHNLFNLSRTVGVDLVTVTPNMQVVKKICRISLKKMGDVCWHCHRGCYVVPVQIAVKYKVPLIIYGEDQRREYGYGDPNKEYEMFDRYEHYEKVSLEDLKRTGISEKDLLSYVYPPKKEMEKIGVRGINLGNYIKWDARRQVEFIKKHLDWWGAGKSKEKAGYLKGGKCEGTYTDYENVECLMPGVHDYLRWLKLGYGRATDSACIDIRFGRLTREEGFKKLEFERRRPESLDWALEYLETTEEKFMNIALSMRDKRLGPLDWKKMKPKTRRITPKGKRSLIAAG